MKDLKRLLFLLSAFSGEIMVSLLLGIAAVAAGIGLLGTSAYLIASAALHPSIAELQVAIVGVRFFGISRAVFRYLERLISHSINLRFLSRLREDFYKRVEPGAPKNLATLRSGDLLQRVMGDLETLENFYVRVISPVVVAFVITLIVSIFLGGFRAELGIILAVGLLITGFIQPAVAVMVSKPLSGRLAVLRAEASALTVEYLQGLEDLQAGSAVKTWGDRLKNVFHQSGALQDELGIVNGINSGVYLLLMNLTILGLLWVAIPVVHSAEMTGVALAVITLVALASFESVAALPAAAQHFDNGLVSAQRLFSLGDQDFKEDEKDVSAPVVTASIEVVNLDLVADENGDVLLEDITFSLTPGKKIAIIGASGSGKTSLVNCLSGFTQPRSGIVRINGTDITTLPAEQLRSYFAVLPESVYLFNASVRENLLLANPDAGEQELRDVLENVELGSWLDTLSDGLDTWVGEHGYKLSGGERQRLAIARLMLQQRPLVLLDEPTSHLDEFTANRVMRILFNNLQKSGVLLITHRLSSLEIMDEILVLENKGVVERGNFADLLRKNGKFKKIFDVEKDYLIEK